MFVLGDPAYYGRFGFARRRQGFVSRYAGPYFQALRLAPDAPKAGRVSLSQSLRGSRLTAMPRYKLTIEYDGTPFVGWQVQDERPVGAGRADGGDRGILRRAASRCRAPAAPMPACMRSARSRISILRPSARPTRCATRSTRICGRIRSRCCRPRTSPADFDARFSALRRHYLYRIVNRRADLALDRGRAWRVPRRLDVEAMHAAAQRLIGKHDFTTFRSTECQAKSPDKTLDRLDVSRDGDEVHITPSARSFLHNQVRSMVGSLVLVGDGKWQPRRSGGARSRPATARRCGPVAPPDGLYLVRVDY